MSTTRDAVHERYRSAALRMAAQPSGCCGPDCCGGPAADREIEACGTSYAPEELAQVVAFLAGEAASYLTGTTVPVEGGRSGITPGTGT